MQHLTAAPPSPPLGDRPPPALSQDEHCVHHGLGPVGRRAQAAPRSQPSLGATSRPGALPSAPDADLGGQWHSDARQRLAGFLTRIMAMEAEEEVG
jgi:hypothetical protein